LELVCFVIALRGGGRYSVDALIGKELWNQKVSQLNGIGSQLGQDAAKP
jgi:hypothetical protein